MVVTVNKLCYIQHTSRITTWGTIFTEIFFGVSKKWDRSWSHASVVTNLKTFTKKLLPVHPKTILRIREKKNEKKKRMAIAKHFALHANAINKKPLPKILD